MSSIANKMSNFRFRISDYHAVADADIKINGVTVIAGPNASGKSTIARWLYYIVHAICDYDKLVVNNGMGPIFDALSRLKTVAGVLDMEDSLKIRNAIDEIRHDFYSGDSSFEEVKNDGLLVINIFLDYLQKKISGNADSLDLRRLSAYLHISRNMLDGKDSALATVENSLSSPIVWSCHDIEHRLSDRSLSNLTDVLEFIVDHDFDESIPHLEFAEEETPLLDADFFRQPLALKRSIYFDTQKIGNALNPSSSTPIRKFLHIRNTAVHPNARIVADMIKNIIDGSIEINKDDDLSFRRNTLIFRMRNGQTIQLKAAATGVISFAYILRLIENGWLNDESLLIIDEPEAHLHPQWIVEYAKILILINKFLGTKVLVSSHNPDFVAAIRAIAIAHEMSGSTNFYIAKEVDVPEYVRHEDYYIPSYEFKCLGCEIAQIFDSFNIALDRIAEYGVQE